MPIAKIVPYAMPGEAQLPDNTVAWELDRDRCALLIHDMQQYFLDAFTSDEPPLTELIGNISVLRKNCATHGVPVVYTAQPAAQSRAERGLLFDFWGPGLAGRAEILRELAPEDGFVVTKRRYSAFHRTELLDVLREWRRDQLLICGVYAHIGCLATIIDAFMHDIQPFAVADALGDFSQAHHTATLRHVATRCGVVTTLSRVRRVLECGP